MRDAHEIAQRLAHAASSLAAELLPAGVREGAEWRIGSLAGERGRSLSVRLTGDKAGLWADFSTGECGDALDLVAAVLFRGERAPALAWAARWLGIGDGGAAAPATTRREPSPPAAAAAAGADPDAERRRKAAIAIFLAAQAKLAGTPAAAYLAARGIDLAELGRQPRSLRFHPSLPNRESGRCWPALVAAVTDGDGVHVATHRTWLARDGEGTWRKAPLRDPKMSLGGVSGGSIRLWRGASHRPLAKAAEGEAVVLAEGIETGLSIALAVPELRVLCAVSLANMARVALPPAVCTVIIAADNDGENSAAARGLDRAVRAFTDQGRQVRIARAPTGKDFNDTLRAGEA